MREIIIKNRNKADVTDEALYALEIDSHRIWQEQGLEAPWMHLSFEEFQQAIRNVPMFVALDAETGELLGMHSFNTYHRQGRDNRQYYYAGGHRTDREGAYQSQNA